MRSNFTRWLLTLAVLAFGVLSTWHLMATPHIEVSSYDVQVDSLTGERKVDVRNSGAAELTIGDLASSCSCTSAKILDHFLEPGESTQIVVKIVGEADATVAVFSNDPDNDRVFVNFSRRRSIAPTKSVSHE